MTAAPSSLQPQRARTWLTLIVAIIVLAATAFVASRELTSGRSDDVAGSGVAATSVRRLPAFTGVELRAANNVAIRVGGSPRVVVHGDDNLLPLVTTDVRHGDLVIGATRGFKTTQSMHVDITVRTLDAITLAGSGVVRADGSVPRLSATLAGAGQLDLASLTARDVVAVLAGAGRIDVTATSSLEAVLAGAGAIFYGGDPLHVTTRVEGTGTVAPR